jgi:hypothetical protein
VHAYDNDNNCFLLFNKVLIFISINVAHNLLLKWQLNEPFAIFLKSIEVEVNISLSFPKLDITNNVFNNCYVDSHAFYGISHCVMFFFPCRIHEAVMLQKKEKKGCMKSFLLDLDSRYVCSHSCS